MDDRIIIVYCLCDDLLKAFRHHEDAQCQMSDAEVLITPLVAALYFRGNFESARTFLREQSYIPRMLSKSRFLRRLKRIRPLLLTLFNILGETWKELNSESIYVLDTFNFAAVKILPIFCRCRAKVENLRATARQNFTFN